MGRYRQKLQHILCDLFDHLSGNFPFKTSSNFQFQKLSNSVPMKILKTPIVIDWYQKFFLGGILIILGKSWPCFHVSCFPIGYAYVMYKLKLQKLNINIILLTFSLKEKKVVKVTRHWRKNFNKLLRSLLKKNVNLPEGKSE